MTFDALLSGAAVVAAIAALLTYGWLLVRRFQMIRLLTGLGLFLTGLALFQAPRMLTLSDGDALIRLAVTALIVAVVAQIASSLRTRPQWNGAERRTVVAHP
ncbi:hypothetical protein KOAAANKH_03488 [Brevundimonas sp. NIBR10]|uniref:hypothetical protein n=1 Tax=Brevundimonas sp. NIBR10 TaxID=3015997 RepID=UPI0022F1BC58|nr:hypothetical protein [Brevundimonas sp. NIBR10]WGM48586.1 hypothetical protein KOAAANKH_03488 [Brevundimonas sp. NIBR10]